MKRNANLPELSPGQAQYVLNRLAKERKLDSTEVARYMSEMHNEIKTLEERLGMLRGAAGISSGSAAAGPAAVTPPSAAAPARRGGRKSRTRAKRPARPQAAAQARPGGPRRASRPAPKAVKASQQLQGIYLSLIKQLPKDKRPSVQKLCKDQGREAAINKMRTMLHK